ncbi:type II toxin-antitoxin system RelE/ParE family toxin [Halanaerobium sp. Z-7514]|uniref:Type II toxin-antitoxin system RelE/ParE family toxin n=1 Tax=Halanaerobium polyolivorans TaxID=2886943 RepID=A0AAW4X2E4_9FIRM|nr:type II toxin-antitoxin system RelE/ParE family toxin [Halanaerobium polyolivorans]
MIVIFDKELNRVKFLIEDGCDVINEFIGGLEQKEAEKVIRIINLLDDLGFKRLILTEMCAGVVGYDNLWYLRAKYRSNIYRVFFFKYFTDDHEVYILVNGIVKKTKRIPPGAISLADRRKKKIIAELEG